MIDTDDCVIISKFDTYEDYCNFIMVWHCYDLIHVTEEEFNELKRRSKDDRNSTNLITLDK